MAFFFLNNLVFGKEDLNRDRQKSLENIYVKSLMENRASMCLLLK